MNIDFPEDLLDSSLLKPIVKSPKVRHREPPISLPEKRELHLVGLRSPLDRSEELSEAKRIILPSPFELGQLDLTTLAGRREVQGWGKPVEWPSCPPSSSSSPRIRKIQLELEKERELYSMHTNAAVKSFERINSLVSELTNLLAQTSDDMFPPAPPGTSLVASPSELEGSHSDLNYHEGIKDVSVTVRSRFFNRKPRCLSFPGLRLHEDLLVTSSLDGIIQYCSMKSRTVTRSFHLPSLLSRSCHAEDMCAIDEANGFLLSTVDISPAGGQRGIESDLTNSPSSIIFLPYMNGEAISPKMVDTPPGNPHQKAISTIVKLEGVNTGLDGQIKFLTGGLDKNVALWSLDKKQSVTSVHEVHKGHTSAVQAITQVRAKPDIIWTGGADCRIVGWSLNERRSTFSNRFTHRISDLQSNHNHSHCMLATFCSPKDQLRLLDSRAPLSQSFHPFGHGELSPISRYLRPSWSREGHLIAMGTSAPQSRISAISVWDIRYLNDAGIPVRSIECGSERRFLACDFWPFGNTIVALGSDCSASFVDFTTG